VTSAPTFKSDEKKSISLKASVTKSSAITSSVATHSKTAKKIDMGAATNYGKGLGINSPTHRNTHSEDLFGADDSVVTTTTTTVRSNRHTLDDIFEDPVDDFNPRAEEIISAPQGDFGDFESAFGGSTSPAPKTVPTATIKATPIATNNDFADFSSAFTPNNPSSQSTSAAVDTLDGDGFLLCSTKQKQEEASTNNNLLSADLFGNSVITSAFASPPSGGNKDLLSDFGDLTLNSMPQGELSSLLLLF
jgi:hypothetical protein